MIARQFTPSEGADHANVRTIATTADLVEHSTASGRPRTGRPMKISRFLAGLLVTTLGVSTILLIGISFVQVRRFGSEWMLPMVALSVVLGILLLAGGFGLMATASAGFDEEEFDRLLNRSESTVPVSLSASGLFAASDERPESGPDRGQS